MEDALDVRLEPALPGELGPLGRLAAWIGGRATRTEPLRVVRTLARHRRLFRRWLPLATGLLRGTALPREDVELAILRTAWNSGCWYVWVQHVALAPAVLGSGIPERVAEGPAAEGWTSRQQALLTAVDELHDARVITDATWARLVTELSVDELIELCFVAGHYDMLAMALNSLGVVPEPRALARIEADPATADATRTLWRTLARRRA